jgi:hypothetical protein
MKGEIRDTRGERGERACRGFTGEKTGKEVNYRMRAVSSRGFLWGLAALCFSPNGFRELSRDAALHARPAARIPVFAVPARFSGSTSALAQICSEGLFNGYGK